MSNHTYIESEQAAKSLDSRVLPLSAATPTKIKSSHLERLAVVYVRQSTKQQVLEHRESTARQYALVDRAIAFGWTRDRVEVIDEDLGQSGASSQTRNGFQRLLTEISNDSVGMVLGLEMSRLSRSGKDWHALLELCAIRSSQFSQRPRHSKNDSGTIPLATGLSSAFSGPKARHNRQARVTTP